MPDKLTACKDCVWRFCKPVLFQESQFPPPCQRPWDRLEKKGDGIWIYTDYCHAPIQFFYYEALFIAKESARCRDINTDGRCKHFKERDDESK